MTELLNSTAKAEDGSIIFVDDASKDIQYFCPVCGKDFIFRKGEVNRPHFSHKILSPNCTPEGVLHYSFKHMLAEKLTKYIQDNKPVVLNWRCKERGVDHSTFLLDKVSRVKIEYNSGKYRADIALLDSNSVALYVIEVIVTHSPEEETLSYYQSIGVPVIEWKVYGRVDLKWLNRRKAVLEGDITASISCDESKCRLKWREDWNSKYGDEVQAVEHSNIRFSPYVLPVNIVNLTLDGARRKLKSSGYVYSLRTVKEMGEWLDVEDDYKTRRINVSTKDGKIVEVLGFK